MTGTLTYAAASEHVSELHAVALSNRRIVGKPRRDRRRLALPGARRLRRAFA